MLTSPKDNIYSSITWLFFSLVVEQGEDIMVSLPGEPQVSKAYSLCNFLLDFEGILAFSFAIILMIPSPFLRQMSRMQRTVSKTITMTLNTIKELMHRIMSQLNFCTWSASNITPLKMIREMQRRQKTHSFTKCWTLMSLLSHWASWRTKAIMMRQVASSKSTPKKAVSYTKKRITAAQSTLRSTKTSG